jgi:uncharacterized protein YcfJ
MFKPISLPADAVDSSTARGMQAPVILACCAAAALISGCVTTVPIGPTVPAMPPPNKPFEAFVQDDQLCRQWASASVGPNRDAAINQMLASTLTGAAIGAIAGALTGGRNAGTGAALGTVVGSGVGAEQGAMTGWTAQRNYDVAYQQCMYARGNVIPGYNPYPTPPPPLPR